MPRRQRIGWTWNELGNANPLGVILTRDGKISEWNLREFLETGDEDVARFMADLNRIAPATRRSRALDFGCGVGRITRGLTNHFENVVGLDVAPSMVERARALNADRPRCTFVCNRASHLRQLPSASFDVIYSRLVLQHLPPPTVRQYLAEFMRVLAPGGVLMFQLTEVAPVSGRAWKRRLPPTIVAAWRRLKYVVLTRRDGAQVAMYGMDRRDVVRVIADAGGRVLAANPDQSHGSEGFGFEYWVTRAS